MKLGKLILITPILVMVGVACGSASGGQPPDEPSAEEALESEDAGAPAEDEASEATEAQEPVPSGRTDPGFNILVVAQGEVGLRRESWSDYHPTAFGTELHRGDMLRPGSDAQAVVLCDDLRIWTVPAGAPSGLNNGCPPPPESVLVRGASAIGSTRGGSDPTIPYIISPRRTQLLDGHPHLRWNEVPRASSYGVAIKNADSGEIIWETTSDKSGVTYPGQPSLEVGANYLLTVEADNGASSQGEGIPGLGFSLLDESEAQSVREAAGPLGGLGLAAEAETFALAQLYASYGLVAEAIERLETLAEEGSQHAAVYRVLGDLYRQIDLALLAESRYLKAIDLAEVAGDVEGLAMAQAGLGEVNAALGRKDEAVRLLTEALDGFEALGDSQRVDEVATQLEELGR